MDRIATKAADPEVCRSADGGLPRQTRRVCIGTVSVIKGNGGVVSEELRRQNAIREAEEAALRAELAVTRARRNRLLAEDLRMRRTVRKRPLRQRVRDRIADGWAWVMGCIVTYPKLIKMWKQ